MWLGSIPLQGCQNLYHQGGIECAVHSLIYFDKTFITLNLLIMSSANNHDFTPIDYISSNPMDRLSNVTKEILDRGEYIFDVHCHVFDVKTINILYFVSRIIRDNISADSVVAHRPLIDSTGVEMKYLSISEPELYDNLLLKRKFDTDKDWEDVIQEVELLGDTDKSASISSDKIDGSGSQIIRNIGLLGKGTHEEIYEVYMDKFGIHNFPDLVGGNKELIITGLMMDLEQGWDVWVRKNIQEVVDELKILSGEKPVLPFLILDPRRMGRSGEENLEYLFDKAFKSFPSFFGVKLYPGLGYLPSDYRLREIFKICAEKNIPVLSHCGGELISSKADNSIKVYDGSNEITITGNNRKTIARKLNHPKWWAPVLQEFSDLKLNIAHFGSSKSWTRYPNNEEYKDGTEDKNRVVEILELMQKYPNVYSDFSYSFTDQDIYNDLKELINKFDFLKDRLLFGTDFWVVIPEGDLVEEQKMFLKEFAAYRDQFIRDNTYRYLFDMITV